MEPYTEETRPERRYDSNDVKDLNLIYSYLRSWARTVKLNPNPDTGGLIRRFADNARGLFAVADACGPEWGKRARDAVASLVAKEAEAQPDYLIIKHGLAIFDERGLTQPTDVISTLEFNRDLRLLDLPDARWSQYRRPGGRDRSRHPITMHEQAALLRQKPHNAVTSKSRWPPGKRVKGASGKMYIRSEFETALRKHEAARPRGGGPRLRLVTPSAD
jgi:hypothetical protein